ncbi:hypothetical protein AXF42_Ash003713 [Apostasia shenzhenica]|uniref:Uncharacterized protein n=1 Tax=Apostasia shenzhenica TaxID=1088818 RepID=A0A2I0AHW8_9ASPA|nr:hypothetical protein AXF42_Ash003713 [Apostasia shenzhenica]
MRVRHKRTRARRAHRWSWGRRRGAGIGQQVELSERSRGEYWRCEMNEIKLGEEELERVEFRDSHPRPKPFLIQDIDPFQNQIIPRKTQIRFIQHFGNNSNREAFI